MFSSPSNEDDALLATQLCNDPVKTCSFDN
jgi:hypothetical protein